MRAVLKLRARGGSRHGPVAGPVAQVPASFASLGRGRGSSQPRPRRDRSLAGGSAVGPVP